MYGNYSGRGRHREPAFRLLQKALEKDDLPNVMLLYGSEEYLMRWMIGLIVERYVDHASEMFDYIAIDGFSLESASDIIDACDMMPMMSEKKIVTVSDLNSKCRDFSLLAEYVSNVPESTILIITCREKSSLGTAFCKAAAAAGGEYEFGRVDRRTLERFIRKHFGQAGVNPDEDAVRALIDVSGYLDSSSDHTLDNIIADIGKAAAHSRDGRVTAGDVTEAVMGNEERDVFAFTDALAAGDKAGALNMLNVLLSYGGSEFNILGLICSQLETMMLIREAAEKQKPVSYLEKELKLNSYRIKLLSGPASGYSSAELKKMLMKAYEIDRNIKTGVMDAGLALELFVAGV